MTLVLVSPDRFVRHVPLGFAFRDASDLSLVGEELDVRIVDAALPLRNARLGPTPSGTWMTPRLPGLSMELSEKPADWPAKARTFHVAVDDPERRFLPIRFDAKLPARGRLQWPAWAGFDQAKILPILPAGAAPGYKPDYLPLFPSIARTAPGPRATLRAQLAERQADGTDKPAAWAVMAVTVKDKDPSKDKLIALGVAGADGSIAACGAYPKLPGQEAADAAKGRKQVIWDMEIAVYWDELPGDPPDLAAILGQLKSPARVALAEFGKTDPLPVQKLILGHPLTLVTMKSATERLSTLYLTPN
jgi:hypothetical protein